MANIVTQEYIDGIKGGRSFLKRFPDSDPVEMLVNLNRTIKGFDAGSPVGQMLRGERDFWKNQIKIRKGI